LAQLQLDGTDRGLVDPRHQSLEAEGAVLVAAPEVAGADLPDQVSTLEVVRRDPTFTRGVQGAGAGSPQVQRADGGPAERAEAHPRDVDDRHRPEGVAPMPGPAEHLGRGQRAGRVGVRLLVGRRGQREGDLLDDQVVLGGVEVVVGAEAERRVAQLRRGVDPSALVPAERLLVVVVGDDVLAELGADAFEDEPQVPDHGEGPQDRMALLQQVVGGQAQEGHHDHEQEPPDPHDFRPRCDSDRG
jgi:hypothetical protein